MYFYVRCTHGWGLFHAAFAVAEPRKYVLSAFPHASDTYSGILCVFWGCDFLILWTNEDKSSMHFLPSRSSGGKSSMYFYILFFIHVAASSMIFLRMWSPFGNRFDAFSAVVQPLGK